MTIWSSIWHILIASLLISHYTLITSHSSLCVFIPVLFQSTVYAQTSELMDESEKQIKISPGLVPSSSLCLTPYLIFAKFFLLPFFLCLFVCLFTSFFLSFFLLLSSEDTVCQDICVLLQHHRAWMPETFRDKLKCFIYLWPLVSGLTQYCKLPCPKIF